jgi:hypothetical protein
MWLTLPIFSVDLHAEPSSNLFPQGRGGPRSVTPARNLLNAIARGNRRGSLCSQTSIDCWAKIPAIAPCHDAVVTEGMRGLARSPAA